MYNWWYIVVSSMRGWIQYWSKELLHWTHGIFMECYIFTTDGLLDQERYIDVGLTDRKSESLWYKYAASIINLYRSTDGDSKHYLQRNPEITRNITYFRTLEWTHQCGRVRWHLGSSTKYYADQTLYESQWCDDVVGVEHVRNNHLESH